jgi:hypothetical protein
MDGMRDGSSKVAEIGNSDFQNGMETLFISLDRKNVKMSGVINKNYEVGLSIIAKG